ncbi:MAG: hypothetical protein RLZZ232_2333 [Planctomycetota bacterium]
MSILALIWSPLVFLQVYYAHSSEVRKINDILQLQGITLGRQFWWDVEKLDNLAHIIQRGQILEESHSTISSELSYHLRSVSGISRHVVAGFWESSSGTIWATRFGPTPFNRGETIQLAGYEQLQQQLPPIDESGNAGSQLFGPVFDATGNGFMLLARRVKPEQQSAHIVGFILDLKFLLNDCLLTKPKEIAPLNLTIRAPDGALVFGPAEIESDYPCVCTINLPGIIWRIEATPEAGWWSTFLFDLQVYSLLGAVMLAGSGVTMWFVTLRHHTMNQALTETRDALMQANCRLADDVQLRRRTERALQESEARFRSIYDQAAIGVLVVEALSGRLLQINPSAIRLFGRAVEDLQQMTLQTVLPDTHLSPAAEILSAGEGAWECQLTRPNGTACWCRVTMNPLSNPGDSSPRQILVMDDITERKLAEIRQREMETQLIHAQKMEAVGTLAGGVAHDFNNMLQVIIGYSDILLSRNQIEGWVADRIIQIRRAARRAADLTRQLLTFAMQQNVEPRTVDLTDAIPRILKLMRPVVGEDIEVVWKPDTGLHQILVDPAQLDQIMANLVMNSRHAIEIAGRITITAKNAPAGQHIRNEIPAPTCDSVALVVEDNGVGMTPEVQSRMFDPFFTTRDPGKGTGLGLSTVYGIIQQNQGSIHVQTEPGRGTTITMVFRAAEPTVDDDSEDGWASREKLEGTETILLAEDQSELLSILQSSLAQRGYRVLAAHTAAEVLRLVEDTKEPIHLLVTDVIMPGMNGRELANTVLEKRPGLPVLYMSGYARDVITGRKLLPQETEVLQKPFSPRMLHRRIREILDAQCPT